MAKCAWVGFLHFQIDDEGDPPRVWVQDGVPGRGVHAEPWRPDRRVRGVPRWAWAQVVPSSELHFGCIIVIFDDLELIPKSSELHFGCIIVIFDDPAYVEVKMEVIKNQCF